MLRWIDSHSDLHQRARNDSHHIIEETASADANRDHVVLLCDTQTVNRPDRVLCLRPRRAKALEIMLSDEIIACLLHPLHIEWKIAKMCIQSLERHRDLSI